MKSAHVILLLYHINTKLHDGIIKLMWQNDASVRCETANITASYLLMPCDGLGRIV